MSPSAAAAWNRRPCAAIGEGRDAEGIARMVLWAMRRFAGLQSRLDDLTMIAVQVL